MITCLDKGYVDLVDVMGDELSVVNAARASFAKRSETFGDSDARLLRFLLKEGHTSPFRHVMMTFEVKAPLLVARQWWKYVVGSDHTMEGWNEASRRYVTMEPEFYVPTSSQWRSAPDNRKQGSGEPMAEAEGFLLSDYLADVICDGLHFYNKALAMGVAPEQARLLLPAYAMYTNWWWTTSLQTVTHFLAQRIADDAQKEIQEYAQGIKELIEPLFPVTFEALDIK
jgi:thymidylate synthase (FAD)